MKKALDVLRIALVAQGTIAIMLLNILQQFVGEFECFLSSTSLQRTVDLTIWAHIGDIALKFVACVYILENLIIVYQSLESIINNNLEAKWGFLPYKKFNSIAYLNIIICWLNELINLGNNYKKLHAHNWKDFLKLKSKAKTVANNIGR